MILPVSERGHFVATMRHTNVWLMETLAAWVPTSPEMEVKLLFGEHIWDVAQHADELGKRTFELRMALQESHQPSAAYLALLAETRATSPTPMRLACVYDLMLPALTRRYQSYLDRTDTLADAPTVRILERHLTDMRRMIAMSNELRNEHPGTRLAEVAQIQELVGREAGIDMLAPIPAVHRAAA